MKFFKKLIIPVLALLIISCSSNEPNENDATAETEITLQEVYKNEIQELANHSQMEEAMEFIQRTDNETVQNQILITEIPAPPFQEEVRAERYAEMMRSYGLDQVEIDEEGNVIGRRPGTEGERNIVISAHLDTVFPEGTEVKVEVRNDTLFAPGITDDTRGLSVLLAILNTYETLNIQTKDNIWFVGTVGEEGLGDLRGVKHLFETEGDNIDAFISIDGSNDSRIVNKALGSHRYRVTFEGPGGHSWGAFGIGNPAHALGRAITHFDEEASEFVKNGPKTSYNVGRIGGGTSVNSVPFANWMEIDMRSESQENLKQIDEILQEAVQEALHEANDIKTEGPQLTVDVEMIGNRPSGIIPSNNPFIQRAIAVSKYFEQEPDLTRSSTDSNVSISMGIPSMTLGGGGSSGGAHSLDEWWYNDEGYKGVQRAFMILTSEAGIAN
ncbi:MAG: M20/M25/M40 family metallo-hydrolase [Gracilimonas sp.]|uniref:M20/M25/M40 family metallo-hydrolase n=1 Tax=Gracilimonas sp. TaxID=1974203 RepID=UPI0019CC2CE2|nr:M20/M25/M40 family metallo-hydrolase [Gracilimonas sp.]MBD3615389.1 M20/M25/M40 family metallo-hydrolase [Gracilimonas sp.]